jgi:hypothetical protein
MLLFLASARDNDVVDSLANRVGIVVMASTNRGGHDIQD